MFLVRPSSGLGFWVLVRKWVISRSVSAGGVEVPSVRAPDEIGESFVLC